MPESPLPVNETLRLEKLKSYTILDTSSEKEFDDIANLASILCNTPIALITFIDQKRQWFKAHTGVDIQETPREISFCQHTILSDGFLEIQDLNKDSRFESNPFVKEAPFIRFYAGASLKTSDGFNLGSVCVIDTVPRILSPDQKKGLIILANTVISRLELNKKNRELEIEKNRTHEVIDTLVISEKKYREIIERAGDIFYTSDAYGNFTYINSSVKKQLGYESEELLNKHFTYIIHPEWIEKVSLFYARQFSEKVPDTLFEFLVKDKEGKSKWVEQVVVLLQEDERITGFQCVVRNIEGRKELEHQLDETLNRFYDLYNNAPFGYHTATFDGIITEINNTELKMLGYEKDEIIGKMSRNEILSETGKNTLLQFMPRLLEEGHIENIESEVIRKDGTPFPVILNMTIVKDKEGKPEFGRTTLIDITERKIAEAEVFRSREMFQKIFDRSPTAMAISSITSGNFLQVNEFFLSLLGYRKEEVIGYSSSDLKLQSSEQREAFALKFRQQGFLRNQETKFRAKDGRIIILIFSSEIVDINGTEQVLTTFHDISGLKELEQQLIEAKDVAEQSVRFQEQFLANMSHEIRTPMNGVIGMTNLLAETDLSSEQTEFVETIKESSNNLLVIINDILDLSKINDGKIIFEEADLNLHNVVRHVVNTLRHRAEENGISLVSLMDSKINTYLSGDQVRLTQILLNLVANAIKFTHKGGVKLSVFHVGETDKTIDLNFIVEDTGIGIKSDKLDSIFNSFTQASSETTLLYGGTGLGLTITKKLIELQGGSISVQSEFNKGSVFNVWMRFKKSSTVFTENQASFQQKESYNLSGKRILLVEDNQINQRVGFLTLSKWGALVDIADNGLSALKMIAEKEYDVILMDLQMPEMDGEETTKNIRNFPGLVCKIPIIAMTASAFRGEKEKCLEMGMDEYISKPFKLSELYAKIAKFVYPE